MSIENNDPKKTIENLTNDQVDGKDVKGGFGPGQPFGPNPAPDMLDHHPPMDDGLGGNLPEEGPGDPMHPGLPDDIEPPIGPMPPPGPFGHPGGPGPMPRP